MIEIPRRMRKLKRDLYDGSFVISLIATIIIQQVFDIPEKIAIGVFLGAWATAFCIHIFRRSKA
jgi:hypothetical protein